MNYVMHKQMQIYIYIYKYIHGSICSDWIGLLGSYLIVGSLEKMFVTKKICIYIYVNMCMASRSFPVGAKTTFLYISCNVFGE